jgi:hypothetical protein
MSRLTTKFLAMSPLEKWETLALNGLLGTDEPWIENMRQSLRAQQEEGEQLRRDLDKALPDATRCEACLAPLFEDDPGILADENGATTCRPAMPPPGAEDSALDLVVPGPCFAYRSLDRTVATAKLEQTRERVG